MRKAEAQMRRDIARCKSNNARVNHRIELVGDESPPPRSTTRAPGGEAGSRLRELQERLSAAEKALQGAQAQARDMANAIAALGKRRENAREKLQLSARRKAHAGEKREGMIGCREMLEAAVKKAAEDVQATKMAQRFGRAANLSRNRGRMDSIVALKAEIERLHQERDEMEAKKRGILIDCARASQRRCVRMDM